MPKAARAAKPVKATRAAKPVKAVKAAKTVKPAKPAAKPAKAVKTAKAPVKPAKPVKAAKSAKPAAKPVKASKTVRAAVKPAKAAKAPAKGARGAKVPAKAVKAPAKTVRTRASKADMSPESLLIKQPRTPKLPKPVDGRRRSTKKVARVLPLPDRDVLISIQDLSPSGQAIKDFRQGIEVNMRAFAELLGVNPATVFRWETERTSRIQSSSQSKLKKLVANVINRKPVKIAG
jgi:DNA-binding transcriptional regulator YiaG